MGRYKYTGRDQKGKKSGIITATSKKDALIQLKKQEVRVIEILEMPETLMTKDITIGNPVKLQHLVIFLRQFATLLQAGVTVVDSTHILAEQTESKALGKALTEIEDELRDGNPLSEAFSRNKKIFEPMLINMLKAGEASGSLDETLEGLATHYEKQHITKQKIISALAYPMVVGVIAIGVVIFLLAAVVPTFVNMLSDFGGELPAITQFVIASSEFMQKFWYIIILFFVFIAITLAMLRKDKRSKYYLDYAILRVPIFGKMLQKAVLARMTRTLSSLFSSSVPILQALAIVEKVVENEVVARVIGESRRSLEKGTSLTDPMKRHWAFPPLVTQMIAIGEETGSLDSMLAKVADFYEKEVESATDRLKSLIEPLMIVMLAGLVGTIVTSILVPMFEIFNNVQNY
ncbi:type II secretion system F family protein [Rossellomorea aquimaris]|jgi:type IV pilus assembly protein PilC|uniref:type II secretion system F family protein n=1 Tax=Rossellomorea aquimaris TaxID=189382 RepID=UPI0011E93A57|nr:type II secretion system F family protein [Rossellomorea aquimaris]TYS87810.1 type II secretion system F family protein [Rossellomorea aquimaris]